MSSMRVTVLFCAFLVALPPLSASSQQAAGTPRGPAIDSSQPVPTIHVTTRLVVLDVVVSDGYGTPAKGLKRSDFTIYEDGVPQAIAGFTERDAADTASPAPEETLPPNTFIVRPPISNSNAMTAIVISAGGAPYFSVQSELRSYLKSATPQTPIAIFRMDWQGMHLVQGFTADRKVLLEAANSRRILPPLGFPVFPYASVPGSPTHNLARYLMGFPGRINVLWLSNGGGAPRDVDHEFPDVESFVQELKQSDNVTRLNPIALYFADANGVAAPKIVWTGFDESVDEMAYQLGYPSAFGTALEDNRDNPGAGLIEALNLKADTMLFDNSSPLSAPTGPTFAGCSYASVAEATGGAGFCNTNGFKEVIARVVSTGSHYYTISYRPTNTNWNGAYRKIRVEVKGLDKIQPPQTSEVSLAWHELTGFGTVQQPKLEYRQGYYARTTPPAPAQAPTGPPAAQADAGVTAAALDAPAGKRRLLASSPKGDPGPHADELQQAMAFGSPTPDAVHFTVVVSAPPTREKVGRNDVLPQDNFLTAPFRDKPFRNFHIHYWVDAADLHFVRTANGNYRDNLRFVAVIYRDDSLVANSLSTLSHIEVTAENLENIQSSGVTLDQTIAIPVQGSYFLRAGVQDSDAGQTGALEFPAEWIKLSSSQTATKLAQATK